MRFSHPHSILSLAVLLALPNAEATNLILNPDFESEQAMLLDVDGKNTLGAANTAPTCGAHGQLYRGAQNYTVLTVPTSNPGFNQDDLNHSNYLFAGWAADQYPGMSLYRKCGNSTVPYRYRPVLSGPKSGNAYVTLNVLSREAQRYLVASLSKPLSVGNRYTLSMWIAKGAKPGQDPKDAVGITPWVYAMRKGQVVRTHAYTPALTGAVASSPEWKELKQTFKAEGGEDKLFIGVRDHNLLWWQQPTCTSWGFDDCDRSYENNDAIYSFDQLSLTCEMPEYESKSQYFDTLKFKDHPDHTWNLASENDPAQFIYRPAPVPIETLSFTVSRNGSPQVTHPMSEFAKAYQANDGQITRILKALGYEVRGGDEFTLWIGYVGCDPHYWSRAVKIACSPDSFERTYPGAKAFAGSAGESKQEITADDRLAQVTFVLSPFPSQTIEKLKFIVTENGVAKAHTWNEFQNAWNASLGVTSALLKALGYKLDPSDEFKLAFQYVGCSTHDLGTVTVKVGCKPSPFEADLSGGKSYLAYAPYQGGVPAKVDPKHDVSTFDLSYPSQEAGNFEMVVSVNGTRVKTIPGAEALTSHTASGSELIRFLAANQISHQRGDQVALALQYRGCGIHPAGEVKLDLGCIATEIDRGVIALGNFISLPGGGTNRVEIQDPASSAVLKLLELPGTFAAAKGKLHLVVSENGTARPPLSYDQMQLAYRMSKGDALQFLTALGIVPAWGSTYTLAVQYSSECEPEISLGSIEVKLAEKQNLPETRLCTRGEPSLKLLPNVLRAGEKIRVQLEGIVTDHAKIQLFDMAGVQVGRWEPNIRGISQLELQLPRALATGHYVLWARFPKCAVNLKLNGRIFIQP